MPSLTARRCAIVAALAAATLAITTTSCSNWKTWSARAVSPDGRYVATAETVRPGGWGTGSAPVTTVQLNWTVGSQAPSLVFAVAAVAADADKPGLLNIGLRWAAPDRLEIRYSKQETVQFQAVKCDGVDIDALAVSQPAASALTNRHGSQASRQVRTLGQPTTDPR